MFCRQWYSGSELSQTLVAIAKRLKKGDPNYCQALLMETWKANQDFFYFNGSQSTSEFFSILFEIDTKKAKAILLDTFYYQYKRYPGEVIYHLDQIIEFADYFEEQDFYEYVYDEYERYNVRLTAGLLEKETDYRWIENYVLSFPIEQAIIQYLIRLFDYPQIEIRKLALRSLYQLVLRDSSMISSILDLWNNQSENVKEHILSLMFSVIVHQPHLLAAQKPTLLSFLNEPHFNIKEQVKEMLLDYAERGGKLEQHEIDRLRSVNIFPHILLPILEEGSLQRGQRFIPSSYQLALLKQLQNFQEKNHDVIERVYTRILRDGWTAQSGSASEGAIHREHNINSNFDTIEINGPYFQSVQRALNAIFDQRIQAQEYDNKAIQTIGPYFRLYDPSDVSASIEKRPQGVNWINSNTSDEDFLAFADIEEQLANFVNREEETITIYEDGHQRSGDDTQRTKRSTYFRIVAFLIASDQPQALDQLNKRQLRPFRIIKNRYRFEIPLGFQNGSAFPIPGIKPIIGLSERAFRGQDDLSIASLLPDMIESLGLTREKPQSLNYLKNNESVLHFFSWQEAFDEGRRRQKPTSASVSLRIKRKVLDDYLDIHHYHLYFLLMLRRTTDKYTPEEDMDWRYFEVIYPLEQSTME